MYVETKSVLQSEFDGTLLYRFTSVEQKKRRDVVTYPAQGLESRTNALISSQ